MNENAERPMNAASCFVSTSVPTSGEGTNVTDFKSSSFSPVDVLRMYVLYM